MFITARYLSISSAAPDFSDDPEMARITGGEYETWLQIRIDILDINEIAELGYDDRCEITYYSGKTRIVDLSFDEMVAVHDEVAMTIEQMRQQFREDAEIDTSYLNRGEA